MKRFFPVFLLLIMLLSCNSPAQADLYKEGIAAYRNNDYKLAEYYFSEAIKIFPYNDKYRYYLAISLVQQGKIIDAEEQYKKVIEISPNSEAAIKAERGLRLISQAKTTFQKDPQGTAMSSILASPKRVSIPIHKTNNAIIIPNVIINGKLGVNFILDTGATYTSISRSTARKLGLDLNYANKVSLKTANGVIQVPRVKLDSININGLEAKGVEVTIHEMPAAQNITGLLGLSFLEKFTVTIDKKNNRIVLEE